MVEVRAGAGKCIISKSVLKKIEIQTCVCHFGQNLSLKNASKCCCKDSSMTQIIKGLALQERILTQHSRIKKHKIMVEHCPLNFACVTSNRTLELVPDWKMCLWCEKIQIHLTLFDIQFHKMFNPMWGRLCPQSLGLWLIQHADEKQTLMEPLTSGLWHTGMSFQQGFLLANHYHLNVINPLDIFLSNGFSWTFFLLL